MLKLLSEVKVLSREFGLEINENGTKIVIIAKQNKNDYIQHVHLQMIDKYTYSSYFGTFIISRGNCTEEIRKPITIAL